MNNMLTPWTTPWPTDGLERTERCPVCHAAERTVLHTDLVDNSFRVAPGKWTLWQCSACRSAYLDPRPTPDTIHLAYNTYYTHQEGRSKDGYASLSPLRKVRRRLVNGYTNWRYGTKATPASALGVLAAFAIPGMKNTLDREYRHLPRVKRAGASLLDVGCGDGSFLRIARGCGWQVIGIDPDLKAVANAARQGLTVHQGGIEHFAGESERFDVITLNHVIEHVHAPLGVLKACHALLRPGGQIWLETPNIDARGHTRFSKDWRGLETPRHLVLFSRSSLQQTLFNAGFRDVRDRVRPNASSGMYRASFAMQLGRSPYEGVPIPTLRRLDMSLAGLGQMLKPAQREFLTVTAAKVS